MTLGHILTQREKKEKKQQAKHEDLSPTNLSISPTKETNFSIQ